MVLIIENLDNPEEVKKCTVCGTYFPSFRLGPEQCNAACFELVERTIVMELHLRKLNDDEA